MSITALIPVLKGPGRRRAVDKVTQLRADVAILLGNLHAAGDEVALLRQDLAQSRIREGEAEQAAAQMRMERDDAIDERDALQSEVDWLRARFGAQIAAEANANRVDVPPMQRIGADQDTAATDVTTLWAARDAGLLGPVTDPGHVKGDR